MALPQGPTRSLVFHYGTSIPSSLLSSPLHGVFVVVREVSKCRKRRARSVLATTRADLIKASPRNLSQNATN